MPTYEYECSGEAKHRFETWQSMKDEPLKECPECGNSVRRVLHPAGIIFKGSGWYITDSRKSSGSESKSESKSDKLESKTEGGESKSDSKGESKSDAKSESKSESKSEAKSDSSSSTAKTNASSE